MSLLHAQSEQCSLSSLDLFSVPPSQTSIEGNKYIEYRPISSIVDSNTIDFSISGNGEEYIALADTILSVQFKIVKEDGGILSPGESTRVAPVNYFLHALFSQIDVTVGDKQVSGAHTTYPYVAYLESLLSYSSDVKKTQLASSLWVEDDDKDENYKKRAEVTKLSKTVQLLGRLHVDFFKTPRLLINNVDIHIRLSRSSDAFCTESRDGQPAIAGAAVIPAIKAKVVLTDCALLVSKVRPSPTIINQHQQTLQSSNCRYPYRKVVTKVVSIPQGNQSVHSDTLFLGQNPIRMVVGFVHHDSFNGDHKSNPFEFPHLDLNFLVLNVNGFSVPAKPLSPDFEHGRFMDAYHTLFSGLDNAWKNNSHGITPAKYKQDTALYVFDLTPDSCSNDTSHVNLITSGFVRLEAKFKNPLVKAVNLICYAELEDMVEIDMTRNVI
jgi:hypothetical protein